MAVPRPGPMGGAGPSFRTAGFRNREIERPLFEASATWTLRQRNQRPFCGALDHGDPVCRCHGAATSRLDRPSAHEGTWDQRPRPGRPGAATQVAAPPALAPAQLRAPEGLGREALALTSSSSAHRPSDACVASPRGGQCAHGPADSPGDRGTRPAARLRPPRPPHLAEAALPDGTQDLEVVEVHCGENRESQVRPQGGCCHGTGSRCHGTGSRCHRTGSRCPQGPRCGRSPRSHVTLAGG